MLKTIDLKKVLFYGGYTIVLFMMYGLLICLLKFLTPQVATFLVEVSPIKDYDHAFNYAIAIETSIFVLTAIGALKAGKRFIVVSIFTQLLFMHGWDHILLKTTWEDPEALSKGWRLFLGSVIFSVMSQIAMWYLSEQIKKVLDLLKAGPQQEAAKPEQSPARIEQEAARLENLLLKLEKTSASLEQIIQIPHAGQKHECKHCDKIFESYLALNAHMRVHSEEKVTV